MCPDAFKARKYGPVPMLSAKVIKNVESSEPFQGKADLKVFATSIRVDSNQLVYGLHEPDSDYLSVRECKMLDKWIQYCRDKDSMKELSPESHDQAYQSAWNAYQDDPQKGEMTYIEIARAAGASEKMIAYIREKELIVEELS